MVLGQREPSDHNADLQAGGGKGAGTPQTTIHQVMHNGSISGRPMGSSPADCPLDESGSGQKWPGPSTCHAGSLDGPDWEELA